jgi:hypothetical protein
LCRSHCSDIEILRIGRRRSAIVERQSSAIFEPATLRRSHQERTDKTMDGRDFDDMTRRLAIGRSRRSVLKGLIGGAAALASVRAGTALAGPKDKVAICHLTGNGQAHLITVSQSAIPAHLAHGDDYLGTDAHCSACGDACASNAACIAGECVADDDNGGDCEAGFGLDANGDCMLCPIGTASAAGLACDPCPVNTFADLVGQAVCTECPEGTSTNDQTGQVSCVTDQVTCASTSTCGPLCDSSGDFVADCTEGCSGNEQCWWMNDVSFEWESAADWVEDQQTCRALDNCGCGGGNESYGGCYQWAVSPY